jgi:dienelactone hydrolase
MTCARVLLSAVLLGLLAGLGGAQPLAGTRPLAPDGDAAARMVAGIDRYLDRELAAAVEKRPALWKLDRSSAEAYSRSLEPYRDRLRRLLGVVDRRMPVTDLEYVGAGGPPEAVGEAVGYHVFAVRWPVLDGVDGEGLLLEPKGKPVACVVALPDADWTPEMLAGLAPGPVDQFRHGEVAANDPDAAALFESWWTGQWKEAQFARRLAENGCRVLVPTLIDRQDTWSGDQRIRMTNEPHREFVYRMAYHMGRHVIGYEIQKVLAAVDWCCREKDHPPVGLYGYGEGGLLALYAGALDERVQATVVSGAFGPREGLWEEPIYRNVWGLLREFGDANVARLYQPRYDGERGPVVLRRHLLVEDCRRFRLDGPPAPHDGRFAAAAPGRLTQPPHDAVDAEAHRADRLLREAPRWLGLARYVAVGEAITSPETLEHFLAMLGVQGPIKPNGPPPTDRRRGVDPAARQHRQFEQLVGYTQRLMRGSEARRDEIFWAKLDTSSPEKYRDSTRSLRDRFWEDVIGKLPAPTMPANPRSRLAYDEPKWKGYEVRLDVYPDVFASGVLLVPKDLKPGERRPAVVCQHGLEGHPDDVVNPRKSTVYNSFGARLADRGYVVYAPQNPYVGGNAFRQVQRKANPLGLSLFSFIVRQHERTLDWLASLPFVDGERIGFYGLSYGGETAMRVPAILDRYALSICSADFNEFTWKTVSLDLPASYMLVNTYEIFDFDMGNTFSHAEMAALIAPRPFMVERGHDDGVGIDEWVAYEYAKVRRLYSRLKMPDRTDIEFFAGGHEIHGQGTFAFLEKHLGPPR